jgi:pyridoxal phosphate enzyme (YggS family)
MDFPGLPARLAQVRESIARAQRRGGWTHDVRIVAVTKSVGPEAVRAAFAAGLTAIGENRVQEAIAKQDVLGDVAAEWHLIGSLQRNKVRHAAGRFALIHSVDRLDLARSFDRRSPGTGRSASSCRSTRSAEPAGAVEPGELASLLDEIRSLNRLELVGLMTMAEFTDDESVQRAAFARLRSLRDEGIRDGHPLPELSMGMSGDYPVAVEEGATMVRLGTVLFGGRLA